MTTIAAIFSRHVAASLAALLISLAMAENGATMPVSNVPTGPEFGVSVIDVAIKKKKRKRIRKHGQGAQGQTHTTPDGQKTPETDPQTNSPGQHANGNRRPPPVLCIDGKLTRHSCRCSSGLVLLRLSKRALRCVAPQGIGKTASKSKQAGAGQVPNSTHNSSRQAGAAIGPGETFVVDEVLVSVNLASPTGIEDSIAQKYSLTRLGSWPIALLERRVIRFRVNGGQTVDAVLAAMAGDADVIGRQPNYLYRRQGAATPRTPSLQYALDKLAIPQALALALGEGVRLAILDSGIDEQHPELAGTVVAAFSASDEDGRPDDPHGTEVAGIIAARGALQGVAPAVQLLDARIFDYGPVSGERLATSIALLRGLDWAASERASVINLSLSGSADPAVQTAISKTVRSGTVVVAAAGNGGGQAPASYPAAYDDVIAATATDFDNSLYSDATRGNYVDVAAPGVDILSPALEDGYSMVSGTSFAAAHVSGVIALIVSRWPGMKPSDIKRKLEATALDLGAAGPDAEFGAGLANAYDALSK